MALVDRMAVVHENRDRTRGVDRQKFRTHVLVATRLDQIDRMRAIGKIQLRQTDTQLLGAKREAIVVELPGLLERQADLGMVSPGDRGATHDPDLSCSAIAQTRVEPQQWSSAKFMNETVARGEQESKGDSRAGGSRPSVCVFRANQPTMEIADGVF